MLSARIQRINELSRKQKTIGLTDQEKAEQALLRRQYIDDLKTQVRQQLDAVEFVDENGKKD